MKDEASMYRNKWKILANVLTAALGSVYIGYCMSFCIPFLYDDFLYYEEHSEDNYPPQKLTVIGQTLKVGVFPLGATIGSLLSIVLIQRLSRRQQIFQRRGSFVLTALVSISGTILTMIMGNQQQIIGRSIQGICAGIYSSIIPVFIYQLCPQQLSEYGMLNQLCIAIGSLVAQLMALNLGQFEIFIYRQQNQQIVEEVGIGFPLALVIIQVILFLGVFRNQTPRYLLLMNRDQEALELIKMSYHEEFVDIAFQEKMSQAVVLLGKKSRSAIDINNGFAMQCSKKAQRLILTMACSVSFLQQISGIYAVILYAPFILDEGDHFQMNSIFEFFYDIFLISEIVGCLMSFYFLKKFDRKTLILVGTMLTCVISTITGIFVAVWGFFGQICFFPNIALTLVFGVTLGPLCWMYPAEILPMNKVPYSSFVNWLTASLVIILFPISMENLQKARWIIFFIPPVCCAILFFIHRKYLVETKLRTNRDIKLQFEKLV